MTFYTPATFDDRDWRPSWTGNYEYPTVTIRGIFDTLEKANEALNSWGCQNDCEIIEHYFEDYPEDYPEGKDIRFSIDYQDAYLTIYFDEHGSYGLNEVIDEEYSACWDEHGYLGVEDY